MIRFSQVSWRRLRYVPRRKVFKKRPGKNVLNTFYFSFLPYPLPIFVVGEGTEISLSCDETTQDFGIRIYFLSSFSSFLLLSSFLFFFLLLRSIYSFAAFCKWILKFFLINIYLSYNYCHMIVWVQIASTKQWFPTTLPSWMVRIDNSSRTINYTIFC